MSENSGSYTTVLEPETSTVDTVETTETAPALTDPTAGITKATTVAGTAGSIAGYATATNSTAAAQSTAPSFQVTVTLDAETHEYFRALAAEDERSLNKYLARELRELAHGK